VPADKPVEWTYLVNFGDGNWRHAGHSLNCASCWGGCGESSFPRSATTIHSVAVDRIPNLPIGRRTLNHWLLPPRLWWVAATDKRCCHSMFAMVYRLANSLAFDGVAIFLGITWWLYVSLRYISLCGYIEKVYVQTSRLVNNFTNPVWKQKVLITVWQDARFHLAFQGWIRELSLQKKYETCGSEVVKSYTCRLVKQFSQTAVESREFLS